jgi:hypothetical protein
MGRALHGRVERDQTISRTEVNMLTGFNRDCAALQTRRICTLALGCGIALCIAGCPEPEGPSLRENSRIAVVRERPGSARVDGVGPIIGFAKGRDCTFMHCLELILESAGRKIGYDELMGMSGLAFRAQFRVDKWDVGNPDPLVGESVLDRLFRGVGWDYDLRIVRREEIDNADAMQRAIRESIDRGHPVLAANIIPPEDWGIIVGYQRDRNWLCRAYNGGAEATDKPATGWPTAVVILNSRRPRPPVRQSYTDAIRDAVELWEKRGAGSHAMGRKAFDNWCQNLTSPADSRYVHPNFWTYIGLIDARGAAVRFLRQIAKEPGFRQAPLLQAADWYDKEVNLLLKGLEFVPPEQRYPDRMPPAELRRRQIEYLREAQGIEEKAIESLRRAM